ncbi:MAG TPA: hypothetical protein VMA98_01540 [Candidatus Acidoferrales bacterium]|nr:hypothetical protein [Candidatus Acidoferrales bacterium]
MIDRILRCAAVFAIAAGLALPVCAMDMGKGVTMTKVSGPYKIELQLLPAEPFYTKAQFDKEHPKDGMLVVGGAAPVRMDDPSHPNHHLIVHVFDKTTGKAITNANVAIRYSSGGAAHSLPIVEMQAIGKGAQSTHYGNNLYLPDGNYTITVTVDGNASTFTVMAMSGSM